MKFPSIRTVWFLSFLVTAGLLLLSFWLQMHRGMIPCPLCTLQRAMFVGLVIIFLLGIFSARVRIFHFFVGLFAALMSSAGLFFAGRQVWLQYHSSGMHADCGVSLQYLMNVLPWDQVLRKVLAGSAECSQVSWQFLSLSLAEWSLVCFAAFLLISLLQMVRVCKVFSRY